MKIDDFLDNYEQEYYQGEVFGESAYTTETVEQMLKDLLDLVAKQAKTKKVGNSGSWLDASVDKDSILNTLEDE